MESVKKSILPVLASTLWVSLSEFLRNEWLLKSMWTDHYASMGLVFPSDPVNGAMWGVWSLLFSIFVYILATRFSLFETTMTAWFAGFGLMWVVTGNMSVLPYGILPFAVPLSLLEAYLATLIITKLKNRKQA